MRPGGAPRQSTRANTQMKTAFFGRFDIRAGMVGVFGFIASIAFSLFVYPRISASVGAELDPDGFGMLGHGLWRLKQFCYYPEAESTVIRGPFYPLLIALALSLSGGAYPLSVQVLQADAVAEQLAHSLDRGTGGRRTPFPHLVHEPHMG